MLSGGGSGLQDDCAAKSKASRVSPEITRTCHRAELNSQDVH